MIAASAGNHALALAYHGQELGIPVTVVMPRIAPITKIQNCRELNANVMIQGAHIGEAKEYAMGLAERESLTYINGFDHPHVIAGAGTLGMEIIEQVRTCGGTPSSLRLWRSSCDTRLVQHPPLLTVCVRCRFPTWKLLSSPWAAQV